MDSPVVIVLRNSGDVRGSLSNCLSRATSKLIIVSPNDDQLLLKAKKAGVVKYLFNLSSQTETLKHNHDHNKDELMTVAQSLQGVPSESKQQEYMLKCNYSLMLDCKLSHDENQLLPKNTTSEVMNLQKDISMEEETSIHPKGKSSGVAIPLQEPCSSIFNVLSSKRGRQRQPSYPPLGQCHSRTPSPYSLPPSPFSPVSQNEVTTFVCDQVSSSNQPTTPIMGPPSPYVMGPPSPFTPVTSRPMKAPPSPFSMPPSPQSNPVSPAPPSPSTSNRRRKVGILPPAPLFN